MSLAEELYIGLMSGTSLDGIDGVVARFSSEGRWIGVLGEASRPFPDGLRRDLTGHTERGALKHEIAATKKFFDDEGAV